MKNGCNVWTEEDTEIVEFDENHFLRRGSEKLELVVAVHKISVKKRKDILIVS